MNTLLAADLWFENLMLGIRSPFILSVFKGITLLGEATLVLILTALACVIIYRARELRAYAVGLAAAVLGAAVSVQMMKMVIDRARPGGLIQSVVDTSSSFPSWHATGSVAFYGFIAFLLCRRYPGKRGIVVAAAAALILLIGFSRLYLGVHFPSDVIAGYLVGGLWLLIGVAITNKYFLQRPED